MVNIILIKKKYVGHQRLPLVMQMCLGLVNRGGWVIPLLREVTLGVVLEKQRRRNL